MRRLLPGLLLLGSTGMGATPEFFAFDNGVGRGQWTPLRQAETLKALGYDGISYNYTTNEQLAERIAAFKKVGLKIYGLYFPTHPDKTPAYDPKLNDAMHMLAGSDTVLWVTVMKPKTPGNYDEEAATAIRDLAAVAATNGLRIAIYPHAGFLVATGADSARMAERVARPNVGASLNLCHEFLSGQGASLDETITLAAPHSTLISINGVDVAHKKYILRLDQGDFDVGAYLQKVFAAGYKGPVGLQCYSVPGDIRDNLAGSIAAWKTLIAEGTQTGK